MLWSTISNVAYRSNSPRATLRPESKLVLMDSETSNTVLSVLWRALNPHWVEWTRLFSVRKVVSCLFTHLSKIFEAAGSRETVLKFTRHSGSALTFFNRGTTFALFQFCGMTQNWREMAKRSLYVGPILSGMDLRIWGGIRSIGDPDLQVLKEASSIDRAWKDANLDFGIWSGKSLIQGSLDWTLRILSSNKSLRWSHRDWLGFNEGDENVGSFNRSALS